MKLSNCKITSFLILFSIMKNIMYTIILVQRRHKSNISVRMRTREESMIFSPSAIDVQLAEENRNMNR